MNEMLDGYKTKITAWVTVAIPIAAMLGYNFDQQDVIQFINDFHNWIAAGFTLAGGLIHYFRGLADKE